MADVIHLHQNRTPRPADPLWREALGRTLRSSREDQGGRLVDVAERAGISPQYLSEIERGRKEPSSEMIAAVAGALGLDLADLLSDIAGTLRRRRPSPNYATEAQPASTPATAPQGTAKAVLRRLPRNPAHHPADPVLLAA